MGKTGRAKSRQTDPLTRENHEAERASVRLARSEEMRAWQYPAFSWSSRPPEASRRGASLPCKGIARPADGRRFRSWSLPVACRLRRREHVLALQRDLEGVGHAGHVVAPAGPPDHVEGALRSRSDRSAVACPSAVIDQGCLGLLPGEEEGGAIARGEGRPVARGEPPGPFFECFLVEARDREQHFAVAHSVEAMDRPGHDPEQALLEDPVLLRLLAERARAGRPGRGQLGLIAQADQAPLDPDRQLGRRIVRRESLRTSSHVGTRMRPAFARWAERPVLEVVEVEFGPLGVVDACRHGRGRRRPSGLARGGTAGAVRLRRSKRTSTGGIGPPASSGSRAPGGGGPGSWP